MLACSKEALAIYSPNAVTFALIHKPEPRLQDCLQLLALLRQVPSKLQLMECQALFKPQPTYPNRFLAQVGPVP